MISSLLITVVVPVLVALLAAQIDREGQSIGEAVIRIAALFIPREERREQRDEWMDHVRAAGRTGFRPIATALSIALVAAPVIAVLARFDGRRGGRGLSSARPAEGDHLDVTVMGSVVVQVKAAKAQRGDGGPPSVVIEALALRNQADQGGNGRSEPR